MTNLEYKLLELTNREDELKDWLNDVEIEIEQTKTQIAKENKLIRHCDFIVTVDQPIGTWIVKHSVGCLVTHKLTGAYNYCNSYKSQYTNKSEAYLNVIATLKDAGWKDE